MYRKYLGSGCVSRSAVLAAHDAHGGAAQPADQPRDQQSAGQHRQPQLGPAHRLPLHRLPHPVQTRAGKNICRIAKKYLTYLKKYLGGCDECAARLDPCQQRAAERVLLRAAGPYTR